MTLTGNLTGLVGWRGMVGSVLIDRMQAEGDFELIEPVFFSTSNVGGDGPTIDGLQKPEVIASSIWVPAPILPNTPTAQQAELLETLDKSSDEDLHSIIRENRGIDPELDAALDRPVYGIRQIITLKIRRENVITKHYKYVDGTSFSAPIVSSVVAQMLEANPSLTPPEIKRILISTAERLPHYEVDRQGWGVIDPRRAVEMALSPERRN